MTRAIKYSLIVYGMFFGSLACMCLVVNGRYDILIALLLLASIITNIALGVKLKQKDDECTKWFDKYLDVELKPTNKKVDLKSTNKKVNLKKG